MTARDDVEAVGLEVIVLADDLHQVAVEAKGLHGGAAVLLSSVCARGEGTLPWRGAR